VIGTITNSLSVVLGKVLRDLFFMA
jgi:hypothetical protein